MDQLLQGDGAVKGFPAGTFMLPTFVKIGHDHVDPAGFSADGGDNAFQVLIMVIRGHMVFLPEKGIGQTVVNDIHQKIEVHSADGFLNDAFSLSGPEPGNPAFEQIGIALIAGEDQAVLMFAFPLPAPFYEVMVHLLAERLAACQRDDPQRACRDRFQVSFFFRHGSPHFLFVNRFLHIRMSGPVSLQKSKLLVIREKILS